MKKTKTFLVIEQFFFVSLYDLVLNFLFERSIEKTNRLLSNKILDRKNTRIIIAGWKECLVQAFRFFFSFSVARALCAMTMHSVICFWLMQRCAAFRLPKQHTQTHVFFFQILCFPCRPATESEKNREMKEAT